MKITTEPRSDQWNADDFIGGPRTFTVAGARTGTAEQKYDVLLEGEERVWRPSLTVLRLLVAGWGDDATKWAGRRVTLFRDPSITFGRDKVGGIRVSHMSDLPNGKPLVEMLTVTRGKRASHTIQPLADAPLAKVDPSEQEIAASTDVVWLKATYRQGVSQARAAQIVARVEVLEQEPVAPGEPA